MSEMSWEAWSEAVGPVYSTEGGWIAVGDLSAADRRMQREVMRIWFHSHYEDPAESCPYESAEGGYQFIWGGPFEADDVLQDEFSGLIPEDVILEFAAELNEQCFEWSMKPESAYLEEYAYQSMAEPEDHLEHCKSSIRLVRALLHTSTNHRAYLNNLLYINLITILESYLSGTFVTRIEADRVKLKRFVKTTPVFKEEKVRLSDIFDTFEHLEHRIKEYLGSFSWHSLDKVLMMFRDTLKVQFPADWQDIRIAIAVRHDLVHRNGRSKDGSPHIIDTKRVEALCTTVIAFVEHLNNQLTRLDSEPGPTDVHEKL